MSNSRKQDSENTFIQEKLELWLTFHPGLALIGFRTTGPRSLGVLEGSTRRQYWPICCKHHEDEHVCISFAFRLAIWLGEPIQDQKRTDWQRSEDSILGNNQNCIRIHWIKDKSHFDYGRTKSSYWSLLDGTQSSKMCVRRLHFSDCLFRGWGAISLWDKSRKQALF